MITAQHYQSQLVVLLIFKIYITFPKCKVQCQQFQFLDLLRFRYCVGPIGIKSKGLFKCRRELRLNYNRFFS